MILIRVLRGPLRGTEIKAPKTPLRTVRSREFRTRDAASSVAFQPCPQRFSITPMATVRALILVRRSTPESNPLTSGSRKELARSNFHEYTAVFRPAGPENGSDPRRGNGEYTRFTHHFGTPQNYPVKLPHFTPANAGT